MHRTLNGSMDLRWYPCNCLGGSMHPPSMMMANVNMSTQKSKFCNTRVYTVKNIKLFYYKMYPGTGNVFLELLCGSMDTFTMMMMCMH